MSKTYITLALRQKIAEAAKHRCGYCLTQAILIGMLLEIEHIIPESLGGTSEETNLWLACSNCNQHKWAKISGIDPLTKTEAPLFNPRQQDWSEHFAWQNDGLYIRGLTAIGRATVATLDTNNAYIVRSRRIWISWGMHPPVD